MAEHAQTQVLSEYWNLTNEVGVILVLHWMHRDGSYQDDSMY